ASLLRTADKSAGLVEAISSSRQDASHPNLHRLDLQDFGSVFRFPWAYWLSSDMRQVLVDSPCVEDGLARVRVGLSTADNFRFLRLRWESSDELKSEQDLRWVPLSKGGEYMPLFDDIHLTLNWEADGREIAATS